MEKDKKDDPRAEGHILDAGHFALDLKPKEIIRLTQDFMARQETDVDVPAHQRINL